MDFPGHSTGKSLLSQCRRHKKPGFDPRSGGSHGENNGNLLLQSCMKIPWRFILCINIVIDIFQMNDILRDVSLSISHYCIIVRSHSPNIIDPLYLNISIQLSHTLDFHLSEVKIKRVLCRENTCNV